MKKLFTLIAVVFISINVFAQAPQKMSYQAVVRNASNALVTNAPVKMRISILQGSVTGTSVYSELHNPITNANGLVSIEIGGGTSPTGTFSAINWGNGTYFLKTQTDPAGGDNYSITGTSQLLSVPYALYSNDVPVKVSATGDTIIIGKTNKIIIPGISNANNTTSPNTITDASGNTYPAVTIGTQVWMAENLRTTKYSDGSNIPVVTDSAQWANNFNDGNSFEQPMMCWYNNDQATYTANKFGALYNWYAINSTSNGNKNVCPNGWHVPTDAEWTHMINVLDPDAAGGSNNNTAGDKMKSIGIQYWQSPNTDATNSSGFSGLPGGSRDVIGRFEGIGLKGGWWSSTGSVTFGASMRRLSSLNGRVVHSIYQAAHGFSVRCIKD